MKLRTGDQNESDESSSLLHPGGAGSRSNTNTPTPKSPSANHSTAATEYGSSSHRECETRNSGHIYTAIATETCEVRISSGDSKSHNKYRKMSGDRDVTRDTNCFSDNYEHWSDGERRHSCTCSETETDSATDKVRYKRRKMKLKSPILFKSGPTISPTPSIHNRHPTSTEEIANHRPKQNELDNDQTPESKEPLDNSIVATSKPFSFRALSRKQKMTLFSFATADFGTFLCLSLLAPFFPQEARSKGVNDTVSGWIFGTFALTQCLFSPFFGKLLPHAGQKFLYLAGLFVAGACTVLFGFMEYVPTDDGAMTYIILCFVIRFVLALGCAANQTACYSLVAELFPDNIGIVFGMGEVFVGLGFMSGPAIGGALYGLGGFPLPFWVIGGLMLFFVFPNFFILSSSKDVVKENNGPSIFVMFKSMSTINNCLCVVVAAMIWSILDPTLEPHLEQFNLGAELVGLLFLLMAASYALSSPIWGWVADKLPDNRLVLLPGFLLSGVGMLFIGPSEVLGFQESDSELWLTIVCLVVLGITGSAALIPTFDVFVVTAEELGFGDDMHTYGMVAGLWGSMYAFGDFLGPALGGFLLDLVGFAWCTTYTAFACFFMAFLLIITMICESKCCVKCCSKCCCRHKREINQERTTETTSLLTDSDNGFKHFSDADLLTSYPPRMYESKDM